jgi:hypothetical protein
MANISNELLDRLIIDDMIKVVSDVLNKISSDKSKLKYTKDLLEYRKIAEAEVAAIPAGQVAEFPKV